MKSGYSYKLKVEYIAQEHGFSTYTPTGLNYTVIHNSKDFNFRYPFGNWEQERIIQFHFDGDAENLEVEIQKVKLYRKGNGKQIGLFVGTVIEELSSHKIPQIVLVATEVGQNTKIKIGGMEELILLGAVLYFLWNLIQ